MFYVVSQVRDSGGARGPSDFVSAMYRRIVLAFSCGKVLPDDYSESEIMSSDYSESHIKSNNYSESNGKTLNWPPIESDTQLKDKDSTVIRL